MGGRGSSTSMNGSTGASNAIKGAPVGSKISSGKETFTKTKAGWKHKGGSVLSDAEMFNYTAQRTSSNYVLTK